MTNDNGSSKSNSKSNHYTKKCFAAALAAVHQFESIRESNTAVAMAAVQQLTQSERGEHGRCLKRAASTQGETGAADTSSDSSDSEVEILEVSGPGRPLAKKRKTIEMSKAIDRLSEKNRASSKLETGAINTLGRCNPENNAAMPPNDTKDAMEHIYLRIASVEGKMETIIALLKTKKD